MFRWLGVVGTVSTFVGATTTVTPAHNAFVGARPALNVMTRSAAIERDDTTALDVTPHADTCIPADRCCKICSKGKACGNTCIRQSYVCHKGRGCACDVDEVCN